jgi:hypothetical protein
LTFSQDKVVCIIGQDKSEGYAPLLVGENIKRYFTEPNLWIDTGKRGIKYKDENIYTSPKLLLRKTGVGISAAIDYSNSLTNQVVYIFRLRGDLVTPVPLELLLGVVNSRAMYYYLVKSHGETEWRSHPYVTQTQILNLPIPSPEILKTLKENTVRSLVGTLKTYTKQNHPISPGVDARVERLIAELYGLNRRDYEVIYDTINTVEELLPVRALKKIGVDEIFCA